MPRKKKFNKIKTLKKISRETEKPYGKSGVHKDKKDKIKKKDLEKELENELENEDNTD